MLPRDEVLFELAGPRAKLFFDPAQTRAGIVTCGGLCPGLPNVIRALFLELHHTYRVAEVLGFRGAQRPPSLSPNGVMRPFSLNCLYSEPLAVRSIRSRHSEPNPSHGRQDDSVGQSRYECLFKNRALLVFQT